MAVGRTNVSGGGGGDRLVKKITVKSDYPCKGGQFYLHDWQVNSDIIDERWVRSDPVSLQISETITANDRYYNPISVRGGLAYTNSESLFWVNIRGNHTEGYRFAETQKIALPSSHRLHGEKASQGNVIVSSNPSEGSSRCELDIFTIEYNGTASARTITVIRYDDEYHATGRGCNICFVEGNKVVLTTEKVVVLREGYETHYVHNGYRTHLIDIASGQVQEIPVFLFDLSLSTGRVVRKRYIGNGEHELALYQWNEQSTSFVELPDKVRTKNPDGVYSHRLSLGGNYGGDPDALIYWASKKVVTPSGDGFMYWRKGFIATSDGLVDLSDWSEVSFSGSGFLYEESGLEVLWSLNFPLYQINRYMHNIIEIAPSVYLISNPNHHRAPKPETTFEIVYGLSRRSNGRFLETKLEPNAVVEAEVWSPGALW